MNNQLLSINLNQIIVTHGTIQFDEYDKLHEEATQLAEQIAQVEVNEENIQVSKKLLAAVNKRVKEMDDMRISIKKEMLAPYNQFEQQVKEILSIVKDADNIVRVQVREMEEQERQEKRAVIAALFEKRLRQYTFGEMFTFEHFLKSAHLNKSTTLSSVESEMVAWLEQIESDLDTIYNLPNKEAVLSVYRTYRDLHSAIKTVEDREEQQRKAAQMMRPDKKKPDFAYKITIYDEENATAIQDFMHSKNINYTIEKVEN